MSGPFEDEWRELKFRANGDIALIRFGDFAETYHGDARAVAPVWGVEVENRWGPDMASVPMEELEGALLALSMEGIRYVLFERQGSKWEEIKGSSF